MTFHGDRLALSREIQAGEGLWNIPEEVPIAFVYNRRNYAVMMGTPENMAEFAIGFSITEGVIKDIHEIKSLDVQYSDKGVNLRVKISAEAIERLDVTLRRRNMVGSASCGLCGLENADVLFKTLPQVAPSPIALKPDSMRKALADMALHQPLNQKTRSVHGAAWVDHDGGIKFTYEDVGRHNALDKLLGQMVHDKIDVKQGFVLMSSRCSYEIVEKAARCGVQALVTMSGPTSFALRKASEANMAIYSRAGQEAVRLI